MQLLRKYSAFFKLVIKSARKFFERKSTMLNRLLFIAPIAIAVSLTLPKTVIADELQDKVKLQEALSSFLEMRNVDGQMTLLDQNDSKLKSVYLSGNHPMIVPLKNGNYFLCADGYDVNGNRVQMDFLVTPKSNGFLVLDAMLNARSSVEQVVESQ